MIYQLRDVENGYIELFCQKEIINNIIYYHNQIVPEMYDHNFILIQDKDNEFEILEFIKKEINLLQNTDKTHLKIVFHPDLSLSEEFWNTMIDYGFEVSNIYYMLFEETVNEAWINHSHCSVKKAITDEDIQIGIDCAIQYATQRMTQELVNKKISQKKELYKKGLLDLYVCYVDNIPVGFCDWYEQGDIIKLEEVTILNKYQGRGLGSEMLRQLLYRAIGECQKQLYIVTDTGNEHNVYSKLGFQTVGVETEIFFMKE